MDDEKEVVVAPTPPTQNPMPEEKITCIMDDGKEVVNAIPPSRQRPIAEEKIVIEAGDEVSQQPVLKSLSVLRIADDSRELLDPNTGTTVYNVGVEIKKHFLRPDEHVVTVHASASCSSATAKVNAKSGDVHISTGDNEPSQKLEKAGTSHGFAVNGAQLSWEPSSMGTDLGQFRLLDAKKRQPLAVWKTDTSVPGQSAKIDFFEQTSPPTETLSMAAIFGILESNTIAANRDDDHGGGSRKFAGVDPGNSMDMGGGGGAGML